MTQHVPYFATVTYSKRSMCVIFNHVDPCAAEALQRGMPGHDAFMPRVYRCCMPPPTGIHYHSQESPGTSQLLEVLHSYTSTLFPGRGTWI